MRVVFQMSVADSSNLIDNPPAGKLGMHRALFSSEEDGRLEKFRPYGLPSEEWLEWVKGGCMRGARPSPGRCNRINAAAPIGAPSCHRRRKRRAFRRPRRRRNGPARRGR